MKEPWRSNAKNRRVRTVSPKTTPTTSSASGEKKSQPSPSKPSSAESSGAWAVHLTASAARELSKLGDALVEAAALLLEDLAEDPFPADAAELKGHPDLWRVPFASGWRIVYRVSRSLRSVKIMRIRPRGSAYEGLDPWHCSLGHCAGGAMAPESQISHG